MDKVLLKQAVMEAAGSVALLADSTKWGTVERFTVTGLDRLDTVVTDDGLPSAVVDRIAEEGPAVLRTS
jgi:DeoR/GlpR family transcriptional regulator of sugar metabolism